MNDAPEVMNLECSIPQSLISAAFIYSINSLKIDKTMYIDHE